MATFNGGPYLRRQLETLACQTLPPCELVVADDGSTDETIEILNAFAQKAPFPVRIQANETRLGYGENFMRAASLCQKELVAFCDQDDVWREDKLELCVAELIRPGVVAVAHRTEEVDVHLRPYGVRVPCIEKRVVLPRMHSHPGFEWLPGCCMVVESSVVREVLRLWPSQRPNCVSNRGINTCLAHDATLYFVAQAMGSIAYLPQPLVQHRQHGGNIASTSSDKAVLLKSMMLVGPKEYAEISTMWHNMADSYREMAEAGRGDVAAILRALAVRLYRGSEAFTRRAQLYSMSTRIDCLKTMVHMIRGGMYSPVSTGGLGRRAAAKDLLWATLIIRGDRGLQAWAARVCDHYLRLSPER
jgi:glycosyltransferase involved in cell wall biosynthesis